MTQFVTREEALLAAAEKLDISPSKYKQAIERFNSIKTHLEQGNYPGTTRVPEVYLQGSFKLGTEIRPFKNSKDADYDIDLVCNLAHSKNATQPSTVKEQVGDRIKKNGTYERLLDDEGKRCWTLNYAEEDGIGFHMDVLPSVSESSLLAQRDAIAATNKSEQNQYTWTTSNPKGFAQWFYERNGFAFEREKLIQKTQVFNNQRQLYNSINDVPNIHVKTPLQRAIQLLKRHRDVRFSQSEVESFKPISMIISVLAAKCYQNETTIFDTLRNLITRLEQQANQLNTQFIYNQAYANSLYSLITRTQDGKWIISNPTNPGENFADRWHEDDHARAKAFFQWIGWLRDDLININHMVESDLFTKSLVNVYRPANLPALNFQVAHKDTGNWPIVLNPSYSASIKGSYKTNVFWKGFKSGQPLLKGKQLKFKLQTNVPRPFKVYWQVVNTGQEARDAKQLRGEISEHVNTSSAETFRTESTSYTGDHWVEGFIIKDGECVAKTGEFIVSVRDIYTR
ncbi:nucleotidyltransferase [Vibrio parahaemolyticus]|uniref:nucleotidyltransferase n=1 Tax=Vibrio parahaemolyticus TaxID=670 RepID=UPI001121BC0F|nr:nucleotidyltransferase [Vibrio parahaemolyticus]MDF4880345.1 nucleotidyltransferase [Vibrio parahaemolyticus]MDG3033857.1 nucleotidyltransferase [Vibrio parahaemolyticus]QRH12895.1 nucleotidyltransferase [Vibrio parahaemolyticus]TOK03534.1 nucleotidyltransferase [Vibrio parahaemolyticus]